MTNLESLGRHSPFMTFLDVSFLSCIIDVLACLLYNLKLLAVLAISQLFTWLVACTKWHETNRTTHCMCSSICTTASLYRLTAYHNPSLCSGMDWIIIDGPRCQAKQKILALELSCIFKLRGHTRAVAERCAQADANTSFTFFHVLSSNLNQSLWEFCIIESKTGVAYQMSWNWNSYNADHVQKGILGMHLISSKSTSNCLHDLYFYRTLNDNILPCCTAYLVHTNTCSTTTYCILFNFWTFLTKEQLNLKSSHKFPQFSFPATLSDESSTPQSPRIMNRLEACERAG